MWLRMAGVLAVLFSAACAMPAEPGELTVLRLEGGWSDGDAGLARAACVEWRGWSSGLLACAVGNDGDATLRRQSLPRGDYYRLFGADRAIAIDIDQARGDGWSDDEIRTLIEHAIGRGAGIRMHVDVGVMSSERMAPGFTQTDRAVCAAAGYCR